MTTLSGPIVSRPPVPGHDVAAAQARARSARPARRAPRATPTPPRAARPRLRRSATPTRRAATVPRSRRPRPRRARRQRAPSRRRAGRQHARRPAADVRHDRHPVTLADQPGGVLRHAVAGGGRRVDPAAVQIGGHQHDRDGAGDRVEQVAVRRVGPQGVAETVPDQHRARLGRIGAQPRGDERDGVGGGAGRAEVEAAAGQRPLVEVHVRVPQAGQEHPPVEVDDLRAPPARAGRARSRRRCRRRRERR